jgi:hypothetical protein
MRKTIANGNGDAALRLTEHSLENSTAKLKHANER